ncbi:unnamed protein product [Arctia plantaginis]|uniref:CHK kinase-like domain-containing protein n=1 Tax=Arctia plantaginis TaxID=874455 RepID=A0A8S0YN09_ARCPL|nr:unnamed protein product [Arctia plantaginis]
MEKAESILNKILPQIAADLNYVNYKIQIDPISSGGANYTSLLYNITIEEGSNAHHFEYYPEEFDRVCRDRKVEFNVENGAMVTADIAMTAKALELVHEEKREMLKKFFDKYGLKEMMKAFQSFRKPVLVHGDYRPSNLMHRNHDDGKIEIKVLDLQTMQATSPMIDLMYFIFTGSDGQFRAQYFEKLLELYYTELEEALKRFHLVPEKVYSRADFDHDLKEKLPLGLKLAAFILPVLTVSEEDAPKVNDDLDISSFCVKNTSDRCAQLLNEVVDDYIKWGILQ